MANKEVKQCRFYVDMLSYFHAVGYSKHFNTGDAKFLYLDPAEPNIEDDYAAATPKEFFKIGKAISLGQTTDATPQNMYKGLPSFTPNYVGILNHNLANLSPYTQGSHYVKIDAVNISTNVKELITSSLWSIANIENEINCGVNMQITGGGLYLKPEQNGWSLFHMTDTEPISLADLSYGYKNSASYNTTATNPFNDQAKLHIGSWSFGRYWDTPYSPNLSLTQTVTFDGIKKTKSTTGKTFSDINHHSIQPWTQYLDPETANTYRSSYEIPSMEFTRSPQLDGGIDNYEGEMYGANYLNEVGKAKLGRKGKRQWSLSFDYLSDTDLWINNEVSSNINTSTTDGSNPQLDDESFQWVWTHTLGGTIPFIFCPNKDLIENDDGTLTDNMVIATFNNKSLQTRQIAPNLYNISVQIQEL